jgi:transposase InsO family protein
VIRRQVQHQQAERRAAEQSARYQVVGACQAVTTCGAAVVQVTRRLALSERTVRRWRRSSDLDRVLPRGRPPQCAPRDDRNQVYQFLKERGASTPLVAVRAAFPTLRRSDLVDLVRRFRRVTRRRAARYQSRLEWRRPGAVWATDFKERREPLEGRYGWILAVKDLGSRCQLAWQPLVEATAEAVREIYVRLFEEHGPPLVLKSDNGGQFKADETKALLAQYAVVPLYSPKRHPQYNGGIERANGQLAGYQEALAQFRQRPAGPTYADAQGALELANELARPAGWRGPTARQLWDERAPLTPAERAAFLTTVAEQRIVARTDWNFAADEPLTHYPAAAVDRRAVRDALLAHDLLRIHPRGKRGRGPVQFTTQQAACAGTISTEEVVTAVPIVDTAPDQRQNPTSVVDQSFEEVHYSADKSSDSGQD